MIRSTLMLIFMVSIFLLIGHLVNNPIVEGFLHDLLRQAHHVANQLLP
jgi:hypothetical protein